MRITVDGVGLGYEEAGSGPPLVLIHGFPLSRGAWRRQLEAFGGAHRVIAPDLPGFGESDARQAPVTMDRFADDLRALMDRLKTGPAVVAGHSMGGYIAFAFLRRHPDLVRGLVLVGTRSGPDTPEGAAGRRVTAGKVRAEGVRVVVDAMAPKMIAAGKADEALVAEIRALMAPSRPEGVAGALLGMAERPDATPQLAGIAVPTLVVTGTEDVLIPASESEALAARVPGAALRLIPGAGHLVAYEQPAAFNDALRAWLAGIGKA